MEGYTGHSSLELARQAACVADLARRGHWKMNRSHQPGIRSVFL